jgi:nitrogen regulatory protein PII
MYKVEAVIRPESLKDVEYALSVLGFDEFTVADAHGHGAQHGPAACYRGVTYELPFVRQMLVEVSVPETALDVVIERIVNSAHTGRPGDGRIFVTPLDEVIEIGTDRPPADAMVRPRTRPRLASIADSTWPSSW